MSAPAELSGAVIGKLTVLHPCGRALRDGAQRAAHIWMCQCECKRYVRRSTRTLLHAQRSGYFRRMLCGSCMDAIRMGRETWRREAYMAYWLKMGSLWPDSTVIRLTESIRRAIHGAYGPPDDTYTGPTEVSDAETWAPPPSFHLHGNGCRDRDGYTLAHIGKVLRISRERVRQIEHSAILKLAIGMFRVDPDLFGGKMPTHRDISDAMTRKDQFDRSAYMKQYNLDKRLRADAASAIDEVDEEEDPFDDAAA